MKSVKVNIVQLDPENYEYYGYNVFLNQNDSAQFIFPDKKLLYSPVLPIDNEAQKSEAVIIGNDIYLQYFSQPYWIHVKNGDTVPILIPGMHATHDIDNYMDGWDLTKNIEKITEDLGVEEINGRKLRHYKVKITKIPVDSMNNLSEGERYFLNYILGLNFESLKETSVDINKENEDILKIVDNNIRYVFDGNEIIIPLPESLSIPIMYQFVGVGGYEDDPSSWDFDIKTWAIEAEIWVGEEDFLVYKEKYRTEHSEFNYYPNDSEEEKKEKEEYPWEQDQVYEDGLEIVYSDFNTDIKIEIPTENVIEIDEYLKQFGYSSQEDYREDAVMVKIEERDYKRKSDLQGIRSDLNDFMYSQAENKKPPYYPNTNNILQKINDNSSVLQTLVPEYIDSLPVDFVFLGFGHSSNSFLLIILFPFLFFNLLPHHPHRIHDLIIRQRSHRLLLEFLKHPFGEVVLGVE